MGNFCGNCGTQLHDGQSYCHKCGVATVQESVHPAPAPTGKLNDETLPPQGQSIQPAQEQYDYEFDVPEETPRDLALVLPVAQGSYGFQRGMPEEASTDVAFDSPVLSTWKTSILFSVLGGTLGPTLLAILSGTVSLVLCYLIELLTQSNLLTRILWEPLGSIILCSALLVYLLVVYPSYFTEKPLLKSSKAISFANFMAGSFVFGWIWNNNLTKKRKGISNIVAAVLYGVLCALIILSLFSGLFSNLSLINALNTPSWSELELSPVSKNTKPLERTGASRIYTDAQTGANFVVPLMWTEKPLSQKREYIDAKFLIPNGGVVVYGSYDVWSKFPEEEKKDMTKEDFLNNLDELFGDDFGDVSSDGVQEITLNGVEYFLMSLKSSAPPAGAYMIVLLHLDNGYMYQFQFTSAGEPTDTETELQTFYSMVASTVYP